MLGNIATNYMYHSLLSPRFCWIAKAEEFKNGGNDAYSKKEFNNAIKLYTEGIKVNCRDDELKAKLFNNRSTAYFYLSKILLFYLQLKQNYRKC